MSQSAISALAVLVKAYTGIVLGKNQMHLISTRLKGLLREFDLASLDELVMTLKTTRNPQLMDGFITAMTTQETSFFRHEGAFDLLTQKLLPDALEARGKHFPLSLNPIRIWSAGCSKGQEPYAIAMAIKSAFPQATGRTVKILASDICAQAVAYGREGVYNSTETKRGLTPEMKTRFFQTVPGGLRVCAEIREMVEFEQRNILHSLPQGSQWDVIFCRHVALYFSEVDRKRLFTSMASQLAPWGALVTGSSENPCRHVPEWEPHWLGNTCYYRLTPLRSLLPQS